MYVKLSELKRIGLTRIPPNVTKLIKKQPYVCITCIKGVEIDINYNLLTANIKVPPEYFSQKKVKIKRRKITPVESKGWFIEYDSLYSKYSTHNELRTKLNFNYFFSNKNFYTDFVHYSDQNENKLIRLDSMLRIDDVPNIREIDIGDIYLQNSIWNYYLRVGGFRIGTNYDLRPDIITYPLPDFSGKIAVPSSIDIFVENAKVFSQNLKPGPFEIRDIPVITPEGNIRVVIRDVLGREKIVEIPYATDRNLLKKGLKDYFFTAGFLRKDYLNKSFDYSKFVINSEYRKGLTDNLTGGFSFYLQGLDGLNTGFGIYYLLGKFGLISPNLSFSYDKKKSSTGFQYGITYSKNLRFLRLRLSAIKSSDNFFMPSNVYGQPKDYYNALVGFRLFKFGFLNFSYIKRTYFDHPDSTNINVSYSKNLFKRINVSLSYNMYKSETNNKSFRFSINIPIGKSYYSSLNYQKNENQTKYSLSINQRYNPFDKFSFKGRIEKTQEYNNIYVDLSYNAKYATVYSEISYSSGFDNPPSYRIGLQGSLVRLGGKFFLRRAVQDSFGVVKIEPPIKNAKVLVNNRYAGKTDKEGTLFIPTFYPYYPNEVSIDPSSLDVKTYIDKNVITFVPYKNHGYLIKFNAEQMNSVRLKIKFPDGTFPEPGTHFYVDGKRVGIIGYKGKAFIENISVGEHTATIDYGYTGCSFKIKITKDIIKKVVPYIGEYICRPIKEGKNEDSKNNID